MEGSISVCLLVCLIISYEPLNRCASNYDRTTGTFFARFTRCKFRRSTFVEQISFQAKLGSCASLIKVYRLKFSTFYKYKY